MITNKALAKKFETKYSLPVRYFGLSKEQIGSENWKFRRLITNVLVAASSEDNTLAAAEEIFEIYPTAKKLITADRDVLVKILNKNHIRFSVKKAINITKVASIIVNCEGGKVPFERGSLEHMPGVGRHTASIVQALAFGMPAFGVDLHVRRIAKRLGLVTEKASDLSIEKTLSVGVPSQDLGAYSRAFVDFGKETCGATPDCGNCFIKAKCATGSGVAVKAPKTNRVLEYKELKTGKYPVVAGSSEREYIVTVSTAGSPSCNCKGYRFKRTCSHVKEIAA